MRQPLVIGFVAENANGVLRDSSHGLGFGFALQGYRLEIINLFDADCFEELRRFAATDDLQFCFGYAGIGAHLKDGDASLWDKYQISFLSLLYDHPFYHPTHHMAPSRFICNCYAVRDFLDIQQRYIKSPQPGTMLNIASVGYADPFDYTWTNPAWRDRNLPPVFIKTGFDVKTIEDSFDVMPPNYRAMVEDCLAVAKTDGDLIIADIIRDRFRSLGVDPQPADAKNWDDFVYLVRVVDQYMRHWRSTQLVEGLKHLPILVIGDGWDHIDREGAAAKFLPAMSIEGVKQLIATTRIVLNTHPYARYGWHERVFFGLELGACVVSDRTRFTDRYFAALPNFHGFAWDDADRFTKIAALIGKSQTLEFSPQPAADCLDRYFPPGATVTQMVDLANRIRRGLPIDDPDKEA